MLATETRRILMTPHGTESKMSAPVNYIFTWHALSDACPKCQRLNGREVYDRDIFDEKLWMLGEGEVWDLDANHSMAHCKHDSCNCRCQLEVRVEPSKSLEGDLAMLKAELLLLRDEIRSAVKALRGR